MTLSWKTLRSRCLALPEPFRSTALDIYADARRTHGQYPWDETKILYELDGEVESFEWDAAHAERGLT